MVPQKLHFKFSKQWFLALLLGGVLGAFVSFGYHLFKIHRATNQLRTGFVALKKDVAQFSPSWLDNMHAVNASVADLISQQSIQEVLGPPDSISAERPFDLTRSNFSWTLSHIESGKSLEIKIILSSKTIRSRYASVNVPAFYSTQTSSGLITGSINDLLSSESTSYPSRSLTDYLMTGILYGSGSMVTGWVLWILSLFWSQNRQVYKAALKSFIVYFRSRARISVFQFSLLWLIVFVLASGTGALITTKFEEYRISDEDKLSRRAVNELRTELAALKLDIANLSSTWGSHMMKVEQAIKVVNSPNVLLEVFGKPDQPSLVTLPVTATDSWTFAHTDGVKSISYSFLLGPKHQGMSFTFKGVSCSMSMPGGQISYNEPGGDWMYPYPQPKPPADPKFIVVIKGLFAGGGSIIVLWLLTLAIRSWSRYRSFKQANTILLSEIQNLKV